MTLRTSQYYLDKAAALADVFGAREVVVEPDSVLVDGHRYPVIDDVIVVLPPERYTRMVADSLGTAQRASAAESSPFASDIQDTFGHEWEAHPELLPEHENEFHQYFDLVDVHSLTEATVCDLGCGSGRWSYQLRNQCRKLVLVDFSDAIFVARRNLRDCPTAIFMMGDLTNLPFRSDFADLIICLGVLHHLPMPALAAVRRLKPLAPRILVYLYYALDNRPGYFRGLLAAVTALRRITSRITGSKMRATVSWLLTLAVYVPLIWIGKGLGAFGLGKFVPLYDTYTGTSLRRMRQDVYDRFFTRIEQRVTKSSILKLLDTFETVTISANLPYWHFICEAGAADGSSRPAPYARSGSTDNPQQEAP